MPLQKSNSKSLLPISITRSRSRFIHTVLVRIHSVFATCLWNSILILFTFTAGASNNIKFRISNFVRLLSYPYPYVRRCSNIIFAFQSPIPSFRTHPYLYRFHRNFEYYSLPFPLHAYFRSFLTLITVCSEFLQAVCLPPYIFKFCQLCSCQPPLSQFPSSTHKYLNYVQFDQRAVLICLNQNSFRHRR